MNGKVYKKSPHLGTIITKADYTAPNKDAVEKKATDYATNTIAVKQRMGKKVLQRLARQRIRPTMQWYRDLDMEYRFR